MWAYFALKSFIENTVQVQYSLYIMGQNASMLEILASLNICMASISWHVSGQKSAQAFVSGQSNLCLASSICLWHETKKNRGQKYLFIAKDISSWPDTFVSYLISRLKAFNFHWHTYVGMPQNQASLPFPLCEGCTVHCTCT